MNISVIIPCYNEERTIKKIVTTVKKYTQENDEIIVVDDGSTDNTQYILKNELKDIIDKLIINNQNYGKGYSIRKGISLVEREITLIQDADLEYHPSDYVKLLKPIKDGFADVVYGSRFYGSDETRVLFFWHTLGNKFLTLLSNIFSNLNLTDMEVCYKVFRSKVLKEIKLEENRFGFEPEITAKIAKKDLQIYEVGIKYYGRKYSEGKKITWRDGFSALRCIIYYNFFK
jgi:glycosyltransferase involved in cell wall biosynthesis